MRKFNLVVLVGAMAGLASCGANEKNVTHALPLADKSALASYDCGALEGATASSALKKSHSLMETKYIAELRAFDAEVDQLRASSNRTQAENAALSQKGLTLFDTVNAQTQAAGCQFKGLIPLKKSR